MLLGLAKCVLLSSNPSLTGNHSSFYFEATKKFFENITVNPLETGGWKIFSRQKISQFEERDSKTSKLTDRPTFRKNDQLLEHEKIFSPQNLNQKKIQKGENIDLGSDPKVTPWRQIWIQKLKSKFKNNLIP